MTPSELEALEHDVLEHLAEEDGHVEADLEEAADRASIPDEDPDRSPVRLAVAMAFPAIAAAIMAGGVFIGFEARIYAAVAAALGVALAVWASRFRSPVASNAVIIGGLFGIGLLMVVPSGLGNVASVGMTGRELVMNLTPSRRQTPTLGRKRSFFEELFGNIGTISQPGLPGTQRQ